MTAQDNTAHNDTDSQPPQRRLRHALSVLVVTIASGLLFQVSASTFGATPPADGDLLHLIRHRQEELEAVEAQRDSLAEQVNALVAATPTVESPTEADNFQAVAVQGPGITVTLTDAPAGDIPEGLTANDLVIHQQDIEDVMNAMWDGGAEAMTVQGVRVSARTVIRCIGNVILIDGASYSPPYEISAIGDVEELVGAVESNPRVVNYLEYVRLYGLGWDLKTHESISMPAMSQEVTLTYAKVVQ